MQASTARILTLVAITVAVLLALRFAGSPVSGPLDEPAGDDALPAPVVEAQPDAAVEAMPAILEEYAAECFRRFRERNPRGRILALNANLGNSCSAIVETDEDSGRWMFDWRNLEGHFVHEGELRWPEAWPADAPTTAIDAAEFAPERIRALVEEARTLWPPEQRGDWLYEVIWLPVPYRRPITFIWFSDVTTDDPYDALTVAFDGTTRLADGDDAQAYALHPATRFEMREDHNFKGPLFESTALAESAVSLEGAPEATDPHPLSAMIEHCMHWLHTVNGGERVLRVGIDAGHCFLVLENGSVPDDYYLFEASDRDHFSEHASLIVEPRPQANLLLDRSRLSAALVRERLQQAESSGDASLAVERVAVAWVAGAMIWQFDGRRGDSREQVYLDESGAVIAAPADFPVSVDERDAGFPDTRPALPFVAESANP